MDSLFKPKLALPLAAALRPKNWKEVIGQDHLIPVLSALKKPVSLILYGPPGCGKTTIARILSETWNLPFKHMSATSIGVKEIKDMIAVSEVSGTQALFLDEIHRFSSSQQDSLLDAVENGHITLIGATTENPAFRINRALLSRTQVYKLEPLNEKEMNLLIERAISGTEEGIEVNENIRGLLINSSGGDARRLIGILEILFSNIENGVIWDYQKVQDYLKNQVIQYDKNKENHYDFISAFIKSIRGSDPDAALFYLAAMLEGGEDPLFIMRRLVILASEDIGNATVQALTLAVSGLEAVEKIGMPESRIILAQVTTFLASVAKSNSSYSAIDRAIQFVKGYGAGIKIPGHLRNPVSFLHKKEGAGKNYKYPHEFPGNFVEENYFPDDLHSKPPQFYFPTGNGTEKNLKDRLKSLWEKIGKKKYHD